MSELTITTSELKSNAAVKVLHLKGQLNGATEKELLDHARQAHEGGNRYILLDLSDLEMLSSAGLRAIQNIFKLFTPPADLELIRKPGAEPYKSPYFKLVCPNPQIYYVLNITGFMQNMLVYNNRAEAESSFA